MPPSYVAPVAGKAIRLDQGIDFQGKPGDHVGAIGLARVDYIKDDPEGFGKAIYYTLMDGPKRGQQVYVGHAQPTVHQGQIVQAGDPVATLLLHGLGNASNLSGWTEVGFAKDGAPLPGSAKQFAAFLKNLGSAASTGDQTASTPQASQAPAQSVVQPPTLGQPNVDVSPDPAGSQPFEPAPGSGMGSASSFVAELWNRVQPTSPDTQLLQQNAQSLGG